MIISVRQKKTAITNKFDVFYDTNWRFEAKLGTFSGLQKIQMDNQRRDLHYILSFKFEKQLNGFADPASEAFISPGEENLLVCSYKQRTDGGGRYLVLSYGERDVIIRAFANGSFEYLTIFEGNEQIGLAEHNLTVWDNCHIYKLYIRQEYVDLADALVLAVLRHHALHFLVPFKNRRGQTRLFTRYSSASEARYEVTWLEKYFPDENFYGHMHMKN